MADDTLLNVEDDLPEPPPVVPPPVPVVTAPAPVEPPPVEPPPDPDEQEAVELQGGKYVPLPALKAVRGENKELRAKVADRDALAQQLAQLQGQVAGYRDVQQQLQRPPGAPAGPVAPDPQVVAFARSLDLYTQDASGQAVPDVAKATQILGVMQQVATAAAGQLVRPIAESTARDRSTVNYHWALSVKDPNGKTIPKELVDEVWKSMPLEATANPEIAKTLVFAAAGMDRMRQGPTIAAPPPPVVTEPVGGVPRSRAVMSSLETKVAAERGVKAEDWAKLTTGFTPNRSQVLED